MKKWSNELTELSEEYLYYSGIVVKSPDLDFGVLDIDYDKNIYTISVFGSGKKITFKSINEIINSGWVVD